MNYWLPRVLVGIFAIWLIWAVANGCSIRITSDPTPTPIVEPTAAPTEALPTPTLMPTAPAEAPQVNGFIPSLGDAQTESITGAGAVPTMAPDAAGSAAEEILGRDRCTGVTVKLGGRTTRWKPEGCP